MSRTRLPAPPSLPTIDLGDLDRVIGGAASGDSLSSLLPMMMMMRGRGQSAAPAPQPAPAWKPKVLVDGVEKSLTDRGNGNYTLPEVDADA